MKGQIKNLIDREEAFYTLVTIPRNGSRWTVRDQIFRLTSTLQF